LQSLHIDFSSEHFMVFIIYVENYHFDFGSYPMDETKKWDLIRFVIANVMSDMLDSYCAQVVVDIDDMLVGLVNLHNNEEQDVVGQKERTINKIIEAQHFIKKHYSVQ